MQAHIETMCILRVFTEIFIPGSWSTSSAEILRTVLSETCTTSYIEEITNETCPGNNSSSISVWKFVYTNFRSNCSISSLFSESNSIVTKILNIILCFYVLTSINSVIANHRINCSLIRWCHKEPYICALARKFIGCQCINEKHLKKIQIRLLSITYVGIRHVDLDFRIPLS